MPRNPQLRRIVYAFWITLVVDVSLGVPAFVFALRPEQHHGFARFLDMLGAPAEAITMWLVPGHTLVQPLFDMATTIVLTFAAVWCALWIWGTLSRLWPK